MKATIRYALLCLATMLCASSLRAQTDKKNHETFCYAQRGERQMLLDVQHPEHQRTDKACVIHLFGGGFYGGARDNKECQRVSRGLTERGFTVVTIDYRLRLKETQGDDEKRPGVFGLFDEAIRWAAEDCADAIAYVCTHASGLDIDPNKIILSGSSAGAIGVLQTDYLRCNKDSIVGHLPDNFRPLAVVAYSGAIYTRQGAVRYRYDSPAPTCFFHGTSDKIVNYRHRSVGHTHWAGVNYLDRLFDKQGYSHWTLRFDKLGHEVAILLPYTIPEFEAFVETVISGRQFNYDAHCTDQGLKPSKFSKTTLLRFYSGKVNFEQAPQK